MIEPPKFIDNDSYNGSRTFTWLADIVGLSVDLVSSPQRSYKKEKNEKMPPPPGLKRACARVCMYVVCR